MAQNKKERIKVYRVKVKTVKGERYKGFLLKADSSGVDIARRVKEPHTKITRVAAVNIEKVKIRRRSRVLKAAGIGLLSGAVIGAIAGFADGDDPPCRSQNIFDCLFYIQNTAEEKALGTAIALAVPGALVGALVGTAWKKYWVRGNTKTFQRYLREIKQFSLEQQLSNQRSGI